MLTASLIFYIYRILSQLLLHRFLSRLVLIILILIFLAAHLDGPLFCQLGCRGLSFLLARVENVLIFLNVELLCRFLIRIVKLLIWARSLFWTFVDDIHGIIALFSVWSGNLCFILARKLREISPRNRRFRGLVFCVCKVLAVRLVWAWKTTSYIILLVGHVKMIFEQLLAAVYFSIEVLTIIVVVTLIVIHDLTAPKRASYA